MKLSEKIKDQIRTAMECYRNMDDDEYKQTIQDYISKLDCKLNDAIKEEGSNQTEVQKIFKPLIEVLKHFGETFSKPPYTEPKDRVGDNQRLQADKFATKFIEEEVGLGMLNYEIDKDVLINYLCWVYTQL